MLVLSFKVVRHCSLFSRRAQNSIKLGRKTVTNHWLLLGLCQCYLESLQSIRPINLRFAPLLYWAVIGVPIRVLVPPKFALAFAGTSGQV